jgi:hypothetical protein
MAYCHTSCSVQGWTAELTMYLPLTAMEDQQIMSNIKYQDISLNVSKKGIRNMKLKDGKIIIICALICSRNEISDWYTGITVRTKF